MKFLLKDAPVIQQLKSARSSGGCEIVASRVVNVDVVACAASAAEATMQREGAASAGIRSRVIRDTVSPAHACKGPCRYDTGLGAWATTNRPVLG
jgi:hypothetical protein